MRQLGLFAKYWQPGEVKTRLAAAIGAQRASQVHRACLCCLLARFGALADRRAVAFSPADRQREFTEIAGANWQLQTQSSGDLGARLTHFFQAAFAARADRVVLIGSDSPTLPQEFVERAFEILRHARLVLGPADDGGFYLVGAAGEVPPIFDGIEWGTSRVWRQAIARVRAANLDYQELPPWYDVDDAADLARLRSELANLAGDDPHWQSLQRAIGDIIPSES